MDQAKAVMTFFDTLNNKEQRTTISLTAGRGRGKSAATGIAIAAAIVAGLSNIFVTAPHPENLNTLFHFIVMGLEALGYQENMHYSLVESTNPDFNNAIIRVNIFKAHRQVI
jgi:N-acetyltransferase 10